MCLLKIAMYFVENITLLQDNIFSENVTFSGNKENALALSFLITFFFTLSRGFLKEIVQYFVKKNPFLLRVR